MGDLMLRLAAGLAVLMIAAPALAGEPYVPPTVTPAGKVEPPSDLLADVADLRASVAAQDIAALAPFIGRTVTILNGAIDMHVKRRAEPLGSFKDARAALIELGQNTGGDWDTPDGADLNDMLVRHALEFWGWTLEGEIGWGLDPMAPGAICTYEAQVFDPDEVARVGAQLDVASSSFVMVDAQTSVLKLPGLRAFVGTLEPGQLYALDYDTEAPDGGMAVHMPRGGEGFLTFPQEGMLKPYMSGLCFAKGTQGRWQVVALANTTL